MSGLGHIHWGWKYRKGISYKNNFIFKHAEYEMCLGIPVDKFSSKSWISWSSTERQRSKFGDQWYISNILSHKNGGGSLAKSDRKSKISLA